MRILVTGGAGDIGCVLVPHLLQRGHAVRVLDNLMHGGRELLAGVRLRQAARIGRRRIHRFVVTQMARFDEPT